MEYVLEHVNVISFCNELAKKCFSYWKDDTGERLSMPRLPFCPLSLVINTWFDYIFLNYESSTINSLYGSFYERES